MIILVLGYWLVVCEFGVSDLFCLFSFLYFLIYLVDQISYGFVVSGIVFLEVFENVCCIRNILDSQVGQFDVGGKVVEEDWFNGSWVFNVIILGSFLSIYQCDGVVRCFVGELVVGVFSELFSLQSCGFGVIIVQMVFEVGFEFGEREVIVYNCDFVFFSDRGGIGNCCKGDEDLSGFYDE